MPDTTDEWFDTYYVGTKAKPQKIKFSIRVVSAREDFQMEQNSRDPRGIVNEDAFWDKRLLASVRKEDGSMLNSEELSKMSRPMKNGLIALWSYVNDVDELSFLESISDSKASPKSTQ